MRKLVSILLLMSISVGGFSLGLGNIELNSGRFYRTGDLVREDNEGRLNFLGRKDRQIKIRGFRVELDGIEAILTTHAAVAESATWLTDSEPPSIHASVLLKEANDITEEELKTHVSCNLPHYAVPSRITIRQEFPRTGSGKVDRQALRKTDHNHIVTRD